MSNNQALIPNHLKPWTDARRRWNLSHMHVQMARELGMNSRDAGKLANHRQERWKRSLPEFITHLYIKRFGRMPGVVRTIEEIAAAEKDEAPGKERCVSSRQRQSPSTRFH